MALPYIETHLQHLLQASLNLGYFPKAFKKTTTVVLRKPAKPDYTKAKAYRPIALENTIGKVFESVIADILSYLTEAHELLPANHFGGRPGRSTEDALMLLTENIHKAWKNNQVYTVVYMDVAGAFNNVHHTRLVHNLRKRSIPAPLVAWLENFLKGRSTQLQFNGAKSQSINVPAGVPQGSPLSPLLFMYYNADLLEDEDTNDLALGFIDDIAYGTAGISGTANVRRLKRRLQHAEQWRATHGAQFEVSKYVLVHYTRNYRKETKAGLNISGIWVSPSRSAKYLGVILDQQLNFKEHLQYAIKKGTAAATALGSIGKATWGAPHQHIRQLFRATVMSRLEYAAVIWHRPRADGSTEHTVQARKYTTVCRLGMKAILGCYRTTPTLAMEVDSGIPPAWLSLQTKALSSIARFKSLHHDHPLKPWLKSARKLATRNSKVSHASNLENIAQQFPEIMIQAVESVIPFKYPPWKPKPPPKAPREGSTSVTKHALRVEIKKLEQEMWDKALAKNVGTKAVQFCKISRYEGTQCGPNLYKRLTREQSTILAQLRTGHCALNQYLWRFKKVESSVCEQCEGDQVETVEHYLIECEAHWEARMKLRRKIGDRRMRVEVLLGDASAVKATLQYIAETRRFESKDD